VNHLIPFFRLAKPDSIEINRIELDSTNWRLLYTRSGDDTDSVSLRNLSDIQIIYAHKEGAPESKTVPLDPGDQENIDTDISQIYGKATSDSKTATVLVKTHYFSKKRISQLHSLMGPSEHIIETQIREIMNNTVERIIKTETESLFDIMKRKWKELKEGN